MGYSFSTCRRLQLGFNQACWCTQSRQQHVCTQSRQQDVCTQKKHNKENNNYKKSVIYILFIYVEWFFLEPQENFTTPKFSQKNFMAHFDGLKIYRIFMTPQIAPENFMTREIALKIRSQNPLYDNINMAGL